MLVDMNSLYDVYEAEMDRQERRRNRMELEEDIELEELPFYEKEK